MSAHFDTRCEAVAPKVHLRCNRFTAIVVTILSLATFSRGADAPRFAGATIAVDTKHYRLYTDVDRDLADDIAQRMDVSYDEYARRLSSIGGATTRDQRFVVNVFRKRVDYMRYTQDRFPNSGGCFLSQTNELCAFVDDAPDQMRATLQHEGFHQFAWTHIGPNFPVWLNEGIATVFGEAIACGGGMSLGQVPPWRVRQLMADIDAGRLIDFRTMITMSDRDWASRMRDKSACVRQYSQAWAMAQFLIFATDDDGTLLYRDRLNAMLRDLRGGATAEVAFSKHFGTNYAGFQNRFIDWACKLQPTAAATYIERQGMLATMLTTLHEYHLRPADVEEFKASASRCGLYVESTRGDATWRSDRNTNVYFGDLAGKPFSRSQLRFERRPGAPLDDLVSVPTKTFSLRTRFYENGGKIVTETIAEP